MLCPQYLQMVLKGEANKSVNNYYSECIRHAKEVLGKPESKDMFDWMKHRIYDHQTLKDNFNYAFSGLTYQFLEFYPFNTLLDVDLEKGVHDTRTTRNVGLFIKLLVKFEFLNCISVLTKSNF